MNFDLTEEQQMLQDSAQRYLQKSYPFDVRLALADEGGAFGEKTGKPWPSWVGSQSLCQKNLVDWGFRR